MSDKGVKIHVATHRHTIYAGSRYDVVFSISGALSLGLQSVIYADACLQGAGGLWVDWIIPLIERKLADFWSTAISKDVCYAIALRDHKGRGRIFEWEGEADGSGFEMREIAEESGLLLSVTGEAAADAKEDILREVGRCSYVAPPEQVLRYAALRTLVKYMRDEKKYPGIGGVVQAARLQRYEANYLVVSRGGKRFLKSAELEDWEISDFPVLDLDHALLDLSKPLIDGLRSAPAA